MRDLVVVKLGGSHASSRHLRTCLDAIAAVAGRVVVVPGGGPFADAVRDAQGAMGFDDAAAHDMALMAMMQYGRALLSLHSRFVVAGDDVAIRTAVAERRVPVWSPWPALRDAPGIPRAWSVTSDSLALVLAQRLGAAELVLVKHASAAAAQGEAAWVSTGLVDAAFPRFRAAFAGAVRIAPPETLSFAMHAAA